VVAVIAHSLEPLTGHFQSAKRAGRRLSFRPMAIWTVCDEI